MKEHILDELHRELEAAIAEGSEEEARAILDEIRDMEREMADREEWEDEGRERGWL